MKQYVCLLKEGKKVVKEVCLGFCGASLAALKECLETCKPPWHRPCPVCYDHFGERALEIPGCFGTVNKRCDDHQNNKTDKRLQFPGYAEKHGLPVIKELFFCPMLEDKIDENICLENIETCRGIEECDCPRLKPPPGETGSETENAPPPATPPSIPPPVSTPPKIEKEVLLVSCSHLRPCTELAHCDFSDEKELTILMEQIRSGVSERIEVTAVEGWYEIRALEGFKLWIAHRCVDPNKKVEVAVVEEKELGTLPNSSDRQSDASQIASLMGEKRPSAIHSSPPPPTLEADPEPVVSGATDETDVVNQSDASGTSLDTSSLDIDQVSVPEATESAADSALTDETRIEPPTLEEQHNESQKEESAMSGNKPSRKMLKQQAEEVLARDNAFEIALVIELWRRKYGFSFEKETKDFFNKSKSWPWQKVQILKVDKEILLRFNPALPKEQRPSSWIMTTLGSKVRSKELQRTLFRQIEERNMPSSEVLSWLKKIHACDTSFDQVEEGKVADWVELLDLNWFPVMAELAEELAKKASNKAPEKQDGKSPTGDEMLSLDDAASVVNELAEKEQDDTSPPDAKPDEASTQLADSSGDHINDETLPSDDAATLVAGLTGESENDGTIPPNANPDEAVAAQPDAVENSYADDGPALSVSSEDAGTAEYDGTSPPDANPDEASTQLADSSGDHINDETLPSDDAATVVAGLTGESENDGTIPPNANPDEAVAAQPAEESEPVSGGGHQQSSSAVLGTALSRSVTDFGSDLQSEVIPPFMAGPAMIACPHYTSVDEEFCRERNQYCSGKCGSPWKLQQAFLGIDESQEIELSMFLLEMKKIGTNLLQNIETLEQSGLGLKTLLVAFGKSTK